MDEVRRQLRQAAAAHRPDRARMLARVERGMTPTERPVPGPSRRAAPWLRIVTATAAVAGVLAAGGYGVAAVLHDQDRDARPERAAPPAHIAPPAPRASTSPGGAPHGTRTEDGPLWSDGSVDPHSNDYWAQSNVTLQTAEPLTALTVELRIARTAGVRPTGAWRTLPETDFTLTARAEGDFLVYRWTLKDGRTVPAGRHVFAGQYDHARGGRDAGADDYAVTVRYGDERAAVRGDFAPRHG
ncbi:hypothetical protein [Streptomyces olivaceiscleroticus]|uniref:PKD domain-containing protein n=1 Tax=Streptomyces olivaceiscleroticus TaxID=68245 RepID=A0ABN1BGX6_9ACTN